MIDIEYVALMIIYDSDNVYDIHILEAFNEEGLKTVHASCISLS